MLDMQIELKEAAGKPKRAVPAGTENMSSARK
jgi:hypothetical protein